jgi:glycosyltransferase involved in cell wall biosynthesis
LLLENTPKVLKVAVCIPTRNQSGFITDALRSAFAQTVTPCDVVVSDDAGTDDTAAVVEAIRATLPPDQRARLRYERSAQQFGIGGNFDRAVRLAQGDFVVKLDSDDVLEPHFIEVLAAQLQSQPQAGWAHCNVFNVRPDLSPLGLAHTRKTSGFYPANEAFSAYLRHNDTCHCVLIRKAAYLAVGGYRREMKTCEDWLLWLELLMAGWGYYYENQPLAKMRKYNARPELMARRRTEFVASVRFMKTRLEQVAREKLSGHASLNEANAMQQFGATAAKLCVASGCDEADATVRQLLFDAACEFYPSSQNWLWQKLGAPLPASATRFLTRLSGLPRHCARAVVQKLRKTGSSKCYAL